VERYSVAIPQDVLDDLARRIDAARWPDDGPAGIGLETVRGLADAWRSSYDWRAAEAELNGFEQWVADGVHCIAEGSGPPLVLLHGWPSSVWEFHRVIPLLRSQFRVVVPSLPGYGFSARRRASIEEMADAVHGLMRALGHAEYLVAGGDWGASIAVRLAHAHPDAVRALHLYMLPLRRPSTWPEAELTSRAALEQWQQEEGGYGHIQGTRPQTLAYGLHDSPVGLLAWIAEKYDAWTDERGVPAEDVLTTATIYWATETMVTSFWPYYARLHGGWVLDDVIEAGGRLRAPLTFLDFPCEIVHVPRAVAERAFDIERWEEPSYGGHFPALEAPDVLVESLRRFSR
jgi:pimeloyl-ACP methyl ester carboxylesterase